RGDDRNIRQRTRKNFALTAPEQGRGQRQYAGQHPSVQNLTSIILVTALFVVDVTKWVTLPDTARVELLMKDQDQLAMSVEILTTLGEISRRMN
ncbi:hypothetical protein Tco_0550095, partial [Tanacetum coccineum]